MKARNSFAASAKTDTKYEGKAQHLTHGRDSWRMVLGKTVCPSSGYQPNGVRVSRRRSDDRDWQRRPSRSAPRAGWGYR
jgi:hypothetical protein